MLKSIIFYSKMKFWTNWFVGVIHLVEPEAVMPRSSQYFASINPCMVNIIPEEKRGGYSDDYGRKVHIE